MSELFIAVAPGRKTWSSVGRSESSARRVLSSLDIPLLSASASDTWNPSLSAVVAPAPARSVLWVCASAARNVALLRPSFVDACENAGNVVPFELHLWVDAPEPCPPVPNVRISSLRLWKRQGPPLVGHVVLIIGEVRPRGYNVPSSATIASILIAAGAVVQTTFNPKEMPSLALVSPHAENTTISPVKECIEANVPLLGGAFPADLVALADICPRKYVMFPSIQRKIVVSVLNEAAFTTVSPGAPIPVRLPGLMPLDTQASPVVLMSPRVLDGESGNSSDLKTASDCEAGAPPKRLKAIRKGSSLKPSTSQLASEESVLPVFLDNADDCALEAINTSDEVSDFDRCRDELPEPEVGSQVRTKKRRRPPVISETPPSDDEEDCVPPSSLCQVDATAMHSVGDISEGEGCAEISALPKPSALTYASPRRKKTRRSNDANSGSDSVIDVDVEGLSGQGRDDGATVVQLAQTPSSRRVRLTTPKASRKRMSSESSDDGEESADISPAVSVRRARISKTVNVSPPEMKNAGQTTLDVRGSNSLHIPGDDEVSSRGCAPAEGSQYDGLDDGGSLKRDALKALAEGGGDRVARVCNDDFGRFTFFGAPSPVDIRRLLIGEKAGKVKNIAKSPEGACLDGSYDPEVDSTPARVTRSRKTQSGNPRALVEASSSDFGMSQDEVLQAEPPAEGSHGGYLLLERKYLRPMAVFGVESLYSGSSVAPGFVEDDEQCELLLDDSMRMFIPHAVQGAALSNVWSREPDRRDQLFRKCCSSLVSSGAVFKHLVPRKFCGSRSFKIRYILGAFIRLLKLSPSKSPLSDLVHHMFQLRDRTSDNDIATELVLRADVNTLCESNRAVLEIWLRLLHFSSQSSDVESIWTFAKEFAVLKLSYPSQSVRTEPTTASQVLADKPNVSNVFKWALWCCRLMSFVDSLHLVELSSEESQAVPAEQTKDSLNRTPSREKWSLLSRVVEELDSHFSTISQKFSIEDRNQLVDVLKCIVLNVPLFRWEASEESMVQIISLVHNVLQKNPTWCTCVGSPAVLRGLSSPDDFLAVRSRLLTELSSPCDCLFLVCWLTLNRKSRACAGSPGNATVRTVGRVLREATVFLKTAKGENQVSSFRHSVTLAVAAVDGASGDGSDSGQLENSLRGVISSMAPSLRTLDVGFGKVEMSQWDTVLEAVGSRVCPLLGRGVGLQGYTKFLVSSFLHASGPMLSQADRSGSKSKCVAKAEASRQVVQMSRNQSLRILDCLDRVVGHVVAWFKSKANCANEGGLALLSRDCLFLAKAGTKCGHLLCRARIRVGDGLCTRSSEDELIASCVGFLGSIMALSAAAFRNLGSDHTGSVPKDWNEQVSVAVEPIVMVFSSDVFSSLVDVMHQPRSPETDANLLVRTKTSKLISRFIGVCSMVSPKHKSRLLLPNSFGSIMSCIQDVGMDVLCPPVSSVPVSKSPSGTAGNPLLQSRSGRVCFQAFWTALLDGPWVSTIFDNVQKLVPVAAAAWFSLLVASETMVPGKELVGLVYSWKRLLSTNPRFHVFSASEIAREVSGTVDEDIVDIFHRFRHLELLNSLGSLAQCRLESTQFHALVMNLRQIAVGRLEVTRSMVKSSSASSTLTVTERNEHQRVYQVYCSAVLFALEASASKRLTGTREASARLHANTFKAELALGLIRSSLEKTGCGLGRTECAVLSKANNCSCCSDPEGLFSCIASSLMLGLAYVPLRDREYQLKMEVTRISRSLVERDRADYLFMWSPKRIPVLDTLCGASFLAGDSLRTATWKSWRTHIQESVVATPLRSKPFGSKDHVNALKHVSRILAIHESSTSTMAEALVEATPLTRAVLDSLANRTSGSDELYSKAALDHCQSISSLLERLATGPKSQIATNEQLRRSILALSGGLDFHLDMLRDGL